MPVLYGVTFTETIGYLPRDIQRGIPGDKSWDHWPGWSIAVRGSRVLITRAPIDLTEDGVSGVPPAAREEQEANAKEGTTELRLVYSVPTSVAILLYVDVEPTGKGEWAEKTPTPALGKLLAERKARPPALVAKPVAAYQGPPVTPVRMAGPTPPGPTRPVTPPPSIIVMDEDEPEAAP